MPILDPTQAEAMMNGLRTFGSNLLVLSQSRPDFLKELPDLSYRVQQLMNDTEQLRFADMLDLQPGELGNLLSVTATLGSISLEVLNAGELRQLVEQVVSLLENLLKNNTSVIDDLLHKISGLMGLAVQPDIPAGAQEEAQSDVSSLESGDPQDAVITPKSEARNFWLIKLRYSTWDKKFKEGETEISYTTYENYKKNIKRPGYALFLELKEGEQVIGYGFEEVDGAMCLLEVTEEVHINPEHGEIVVLKLIKRISPVILLSALSEHMSFAGEFRSAPNKRLFKVDRELYDWVSAYSASDRGAFISSIATDAPAVNLPDALDFTSDINAMATLIAYNAVQPPLAIGLFGNWGSGKSFFMNKLRKRIGELQVTGQTTYCQQIVHVPFNSWHYSDSNLWASLMTNIFSALDQYSKNPDNGVLKTMFDNLHSTKELQQTTEAERKVAEEKIQALETEQQALDQQIADSRNSLDNLKITDYANAVWADQDLQQKVRELTNNSTQTLDNEQEIRTALSTLNKSGGKLLELWNFLYSPKSGKSKQAIALGIISFLIAAGLTWLCVVFHSYVGQVFSIAAGILAPILVPVIRYGPAIYAKLDKYVTGLQHTYSRLEQEAAQKYSGEKQSLQTGLAAAEKDKAAIDQKLTDINTHKDQLESALNDISSGKKVLEFIENRVSDNRYSGNLGIISWIRKDFEELNFLLKQQRDPLFLAESGRVPVPGVYEIDRIILYIDDLDRCKSAIVMDVLEAIHLLLAFPLFVVVVGVDPRWMHHAVNDKYGQMLGGGDSEQGGTATPATSFDYLEKIFQVPFALKPVDQHGRNSLISDQLNVKKTGPAPAKIQSGAGSGSNQQTDSTGGREENSGAVGQQQTMPGVSGQQPVSEHLLEITPEEESFMQALSFMIGDSPRSIKRYINIYRMMRVHPRFVFRGQTEYEDYFAVMVLLGVLTSSPEIAADFFNAIAATATENEVLEKSEKPPVLFKAFLKGFTAKQTEKEGHLITLAEKMQEDDTLKQFSAMDLNVFLANMELVRRFSFREMVAA